jgi:hypothetical protein
MVSRLEEQAKRDSAFILVAEQVFFIPWNSALSHRSAVTSVRCHICALSHLCAVTSLNCNILALSHLSAVTS